MQLDTTNISTGYQRNLDEVKALVLFKDAKNLEFINSLDGFFNILDMRGNRILTKCKLDNPYCITHLPQKGKIYGRDQIQLKNRYFIKALRRINLPLEVS